MAPPPRLAAVKAGKFAVGKLDDAVSDPNDPELENRKADKKKIAGGRLRGTLQRTALFIWKKLKGKSPEEMEAEAQEKEAKEAAAAAAAAAEDTASRPGVVAVAL